MQGMPRALELANGRSVEFSSRFLEGRASAASAQTVLVYGVCAVGAL